MAHWSEQAHAAAQADTKSGNAGGAARGCAKNKWLVVGEVEEPPRWKTESQVEEPPRWRTESKVEDPK